MHRQQMKIHAHRTTRKNKRFRENREISGCCFFTIHPMTILYYGYASTTQLFVKGHGFMYIYVDVDEADIK